MNPHTPVSTAAQSPTTPKTSNTASAVTANSGTAQRIDDFIKCKLSAANEDAASGISDSANRAAQLGFAGAANVRYSRFLEAFRSSPHLTSMYSEKYPSSLFLPWPALHAVIKALDLWVELPEHYRGAVPAEQLPWMEIFELDPEDVVDPDEVGDMLPDRITDWVAIVQGALRPFSRYDRSDYRPVLDNLDRPHLHKQKRAVMDAWEQARDSFFVVAPPDAFSTKEDWLARFRKLTSDLAHLTKTPPDDPLVIRFCRGGCLVVAAWGDEASALNELTREVGV